MFGILLLSFLAAASAVPVVDEAQQYAEQYPNQYPDGDHPLYGKNQKWFQGDIRFPGDEDAKDPMSVIIGANYKWPNNVVPYFIDGAFTSWEVNIILGAMAQLEQNVGYCIRFVPRTWESDYVWIIKNGGGCWSYVGRIGGAQQMSLDAGCVHHGTVMHEWLHALGHHHEHQRGDQASYVTIHYNNILPEFHYAFYPEIEGWTIDHLGTPYDYSSIMHYNAYAFAINQNQPTITPHQNVFIGNIDYMTYYDSLRVRINYGCA